MPKARVAAQHALALAPDLAEARALLSGVSLVYDWRPTAAHAELRRATEIAPNQPLVNEMQALYKHFDWPIQRSIRESADRSRAGSAINPTDNL